MADDPEKKFHSIMDKLFSPAPSSSLKGKKRMHPRSTSGLLDLRADSRDTPPATSAAMSGSAPLCRPWDRGDFMKRLSTFKSITWFGKPKVVSAVNCARRGWINVDTDTLACESCGIHLLFTTPTSWSRQQVEKAASVFSLKLDNGHKFLCPWIDNACDERLAEFPPTSPQDLVQKFEERASALSQLSSLPVTTILAFSTMKDSELEELLKQFVEGFLDEQRDVVSARTYDQVKKLISLCGWELRTLPYVVDCKEKPKHHIQQAEIINLPDEISETGPTSKSRKADASEDSSSSDPNMAVLDCRLCGATVGLWTFSLVPRPLEIIRLTGPEETSRESNGQDQEHVETFSFERRTSETSNFSLTIAGGPPPRKQNFRATISVPVIGQNLRARIHPGNSFRQTQITPSGFENIKNAKSCDVIENTRKLNEENETLDEKSNRKRISEILPSIETLSYSGGNKEYVMFDPIHQHRHFCPWIISNSNAPAGWIQTLSALKRQKERSDSSPPKPRLSSSWIQVDDPIASVRNLFKSPVEKRPKQPISKG